MAGYGPARSAQQILGEVRKRSGPVLEDASFALKEIDGTLATVFGDRLLTSPGLNPVTTDEDGYPNHFQRHGDYLAEWTHGNDVTQRYVRVPPIFEDFGMVDVTKFPGVDISGTTDSTAGINAALLAAAGKFKLFIPPGNFKCLTQLDTPSNTYLVGCGKLSRIFCDPANTGRLLWNSAAVDTIVIEGIYFDANYRTTANTLINLGNTATNVHFRNNIVLHQTETDWSLRLGFNGGSVIGNRVGDGGKDGINATDLKNAIISDNRIIGASDDGIALSGAEFCTVSNNIIVNNTSTIKQARSIWMAGAQYCTVVGNYCRGYERGNIELFSGSFTGGTARTTQYNTVAGNICDRAGEHSDAILWGDGIHIRTDGGVVEHCNITGNVILNPRSDGVSVLPENTNGMIRYINISDNVIVSDGTANAGFKTGLGRGIRVDHVPGGQGQSEGIKITDNIIFGFDREGILAQGNGGGFRTKNIIVENNEVVNAGTQITAPTNGILVQYASGYSVRNNTGSDNQSPQSQLGVLLQQNNGVGAVIGNNFVNSSGTPITINQGEDSLPLIVWGNPNFSPWAGATTIAAGAWTLVSGSVYKKTVTITYGCGMAVANVPKLVATTNKVGWSAAITAFTTTGFTAEVFSTVGDPGAVVTGTLYWRAEP